MAAKNDHDLFGKYSAPGQRYQILVPIGWSLKHSGEELQIVSETGETAVTISTFKRTDAASRIDSFKHLKKFLSSESVEKYSILSEKPSRASAEYLKEDGQHWYVSFQENKHALMLATGNATPKAEADEFATAMKIVDSIALN